MRNRYYLLIVSLLCCLGVFGQDFGSTNIALSGDMGSCPGPEQLKTYYHKGARSKESWLLVPKSTVNVKCKIGDKSVVYMTESNFENNNEIQVKHTEFQIEYDYKEFKHLNKPDKPKSLVLYSNLEWTTISKNSTWNNAISYTQEKQDQKQSRGTNGKYYYDYPISEQSWKLNSYELWQNIMSNSDNLRYFNNHGYIDIYFRNVFYTVFESKDEGRGDTHYFGGYTHTPTENVLTIRVFKCEVGDLAVNSECNPKLSDGLYAIFEDQKTEYISVSSTLRKVVDSAVVTNGVYDYVKINEENEKSERFDGKDNEVNKHDISLALFKRNNKLNVNDKIKVRRTIKYENVSFSGKTEICESSKELEFLVLPTPKIVGIANQKSEYIECPVKKEISNGLTAGDFYSDYYTLDGMKCDFGSFEKYADVYNVKYKWKYRKGNGQFRDLPQKGEADRVYSENEIFDFEPENNPDLQLPLWALEEGVTYEFQQCAILSGFENYEILATGEVNSYKITKSRKLDVDKLDVFISEKEVCEEDNLSDVSFTAKYGDNENPNNYKVDQFNYVWEIAEGMTKENGIEGGKLYLTRNFSDIKNDIQFKVSLSDGCKNTITKETSIHVNELPKFTADDISKVSEQLSLTKNHDGSIRVTGIKGRQCKLAITDSEKNKHDYYYSENNDGSNLILISGATFDDKDNMSFNKELYFYKKSKDGSLKCLSHPVKVEFIALNEIQQNKFITEEIFVCSGDNLPALDANNAITSASMEGVSANGIGYLWQYSTDQTNWYDMVNIDANGGKSTFNRESYNGSWEHKITQTTYIRRIAIPKLEDGTVLGEFVSNHLKVSIYSKPTLDLEIDNQISVDPKCYGDEITMSMKLNSAKLSEEQKVMWYFNRTNCITKYGYYHNQGGEKDSTLKESTNGVFDHKMEVRNNYTIRAEIEYCNERISSKEYLVETYPKLDLDPIFGKCMVVGNEVEVKAVKDGYTCEIRRGESVYPAVEGASTAKILLEHQTEYKFDVHVTDNVTGCQSVLNKSIKSTQIKERKTSVGIGPSGDISNKYVCAGTEVEMRSAIEDHDYKAYSWSVDGKTVTGERNFDYKFTPSQTGKDYEIKRICEYYDGTELCYTVEDGITISTYAPLEAPTIELTTDKVCNGEKVEFTAVANGGGQEKEYIITFGGGKSEALSKGAKYIFVSDALTKDTDLMVTVEDAQCNGKDNNLYKANSEKITVKVEKDLNFTISSSPEFITEEDFKDGEITVSVKCAEVDKGDVLYYQINNGKEIEEVYNGVGFTVTMSLEDFEETSGVDLIVRRVGTIAGCESTKVYEYTLNEGFDGGEPLLVGNDKEDEIEVCANSQVDLTISNLKQLTFGGAPITEMTGVKWSWYKGNSRIETTEDPTYTIQVSSTDKTATYYAVFSGKDAGGTVRKVRSNKFVIKTGEGIEVGKIRFEDYAAETFVEYCAGSDTVVTMVSDFEKAELQWLYSKDGGKNWNDVPETMNGQEVTSTNKINISVSELASDIKGDDGKLATEKVYFRLRATDGCGTESYSDNLLLVRFKSSVSMPSPSIVSTLMYGSEVDFPDSLMFGRHFNHADPYIFVGRGDVTDVGNMQRVYFKDVMAFGDNSVDVVRYEKARISEELCMSDTLHYGFKIYKKLANPKLVVNPIDEYFCSNTNDFKYLYLNNIDGGDASSYKTTWQYRIDGYEDWMDIKEGNNQDVFTATIGEIKKNEVGEYQQQVSINKLNQTITVRAMLTCEGDYPGGYVSSNEMTMKVYAPLKDGGIDYTKKEICYNTAVDTIKGFDATGGSGKYTYVWQKSVDAKLFTDLVNGEANDPTFAPWNSGGKYNLKETTYFRRIVKDDVCGTSDTSEIKTVFVRDSFEIVPEDVSYSKIVTNNSRARLYGVTDFSQSGTDEIQYIWWKSLSKEHARSSVGKEVLTEPLEVPDGDDRIKATYYAQALKGGCVSANKLPLEILVYNQNAGHIYIDGEDIDVKEKWICSGEQDLRVLSSEHAINAEFEWYYLIDSKENNITVQGMRDGRVTVKVSTPEVYLDTTNVIRELKNISGGEHYVRIFRVTKVTIDGVSTRLYGDTLTFKVVPTLESVSNSLNSLLYNGNSLAGDIMIEGGKKNYCIGEEPNKILGNLDPQVAEIWADYKKYFGPWLYDKNISGGFKTYYEYQKDNGEWIKDKEYDYAENEYAGMSGYEVKVGNTLLDGSYRVRRVMDDGCSSITSNEVLLSLFDDQLNPDTVTTYAFTPDMTMFNPNNAIRTGYEVGDSIVFMSDDRNLDIVWYSDPQCTEILMDGRSWCGMRITEEVALQKEGDGAYVYVRARRDDCYGEAVAVPFEYGTESDGGTIYINDTIICHNGTYSDIINETDASGQYLAPEYKKMGWTYSWQYKRSSSDKVLWSLIPNEEGSGLSSDVINEYAAISQNQNGPLLIRRVATNEKGRVRYSNVLTLTRYEKLIPGSLSINGTQNKFCSYDELPYVKTTSASGGKVISTYNVTWQYAFNQGEWETVNCIDSLYLGLLVDRIDRKENTEISLRCLYSDECEEVVSEKQSITIYRENEKPSIYQNNDSCDAEIVKLAVYNDGFDKTYQWIAIYIDPSDTTFTETTIWNYVGENVMIVRNGMPTSSYAVRSIDEETKCYSDYYYFNVDSLPELSQTKPEAPIAICIGSDLDIKGGTISGGNGDKSYQWQVSVTGNEEDFSDIVDATSEDLKLDAKFMKAASYFRRIVSDMCDTDTSEIVKVDVRSKVEVSPEDLAFNDFKCPNGIFSAKVVAEKDSMAVFEYWTLAGDTIKATGKEFQMVGFAEDSMSYELVHYVTDTTGLTCQSDIIEVYAHNKPSINHEENIIETENYTPCNESLVKIDGSKLGGGYSEHIKYHWYVNGTEQVGAFDYDLRVRANDDMMILRIADNGCARDTSNKLHIEGQLVFAYDYAKELSMEVVSDSKDSSVVINILGSKLFSEGYEFSGDGEMPSVSSNNIKLPYNFDVYKDSTLEIYAKVPYCVKPYVINPLRGGVISFDGDTYLCGGEAVPQIVVTELDGGSGQPQYQWQYRNERTPDFINIPNATNKSYTPEAIDVETTYRRIAMDGIYKSISNELTLTIKPTPSVALIDNSYTVDELSNLSLHYSSHSYYQWVDNMEMYLIDSALNADRTQWQVSYDKVEWTNAESDKDSLLLSDIDDVAYYRFVAINGCGSDTSSIVKVERRTIEPITDDQIIWSRTDTFVCRIKPDYNVNYLRFNLVTYNYEGTINSRYLYSYRVESDCNAVAWAPKVRVVDPTRQDGYIRYDSIFTENTLQECSVEIRISEMDEDGNKVMPSDDVTLYVTRHDTLRGSYFTKPVKLRVNSFDATFAMSIEDGSEIRVGEKDVIQLKQGDRVRFVPKVTSNIEYGYGDLQYNWSLEQPLNKNYFSVYGGRNGIEGITSEKESPICYYYNGGSYPVSLKVTDGVCEKTVYDTSLYIPENSLRRFSSSLVLEDEMQEGDFKQIDYIDVFPTYVTEFVNVVSTGNATHNVMLVDEVGRILYGEKFSGSVQVPMSGCISGTYFIVVDELERFKIIKR